MIMKFMKHRSFIAIASAMAFSASVTSLYADMVTEWNANLESAIFATAQPVPAQPRFSAIVQVAVYDAVNGIARKYTPYFVTERAPAGARQEAA